MSTLQCRLCAILCLLLLWIENTYTKEVRIVCYYTNWSVYRPGDAKFNPQNINPYLCTHLVYAFGGFTKENTLKPFDKYQDVEKGGYAKFVGLKTYNKNLKTLLAIGGWNEGSTRFSPMVANADRRKELIKNTIKFLRQNHFDGLDLDWEYPSFRDGGKPRDKDNYAQLVQELREEFERESEKTGRPRLLLTMAVPAGIEYINKGYDVPKLTKYLDWMNILSYDYHSAYEPAINHHSPLYPVEEESEYSYDIDLNIDYTIKHYIQSGADKSKLVLGIPTYGRSYTLYNPDANEIGSPADGPGEMGEATRENGYLAYYEICENLKSENWQVENPYPGIMGPYAYKDSQWVSYDDEEIARKKSEYVAEHGLGGIMFWSIDNDDFRGKCGDRPYPIIEAAKEALLKAYGLSDSNLLEATKKPIKSRTRARTRGTTKPISTTEAVVSANSGGRQSPKRKPHRVSSKSQASSTSRRRRPSIRRKTQSTTTESTSVGSSLLVTPSYTTPAPPSTPDSGGEFKCEDEGFFPHPRDCKKYFWCLSGPSDLGIIAHQFTCPAGLYFNKAAASCDYTQNVLCNKKLSKSSSTSSTPAPLSTTTTTTSATSVFTTRRPLPKITAATSRTTYISKSTTPEPEYQDEYEYYDDDNDEESPSKDTEEDPRVIKELIELIRKAGGLEELEKQLKLQDDGAPVTNSDATTQTSLSKSLFQRVLGRTTLRDSLSKTTPKYNFVNRNSRGPQNDGISQIKEENIKPNKSRPQYTSIIRSRSSTEASVEDVNKSDNLDEDNGSDDTKEDNEEVKTTEQSRPFYKKSQPEYVTIRRQRISTTTAETVEESEVESRSFSRKQLGEDNSFTDDTEENDKLVRDTLRSSTTPTPYVTIKRFRPTTTTTEPTDSIVEYKSTAVEDVTTHSLSSTSSPEYVTINRRRPTTDSDTTTSQYVDIRTRSTTSATTTIVPEFSDTEVPVTTIRFRSSTTNVEKDSTTTPTPDEKNTSDNYALNRTNTQVNIPEDENSVESSNNEEEAESLKSESGNINVETINHLKDLTKTEKVDDQITTTASAPTELNTNVANNKRGQSYPGNRPHFNLRRTTAVPLTTISTLTATQKENKVSLLTTPRTSSFRKSAYGTRDLFLNRNKVNKIDNKNGNKENSVIDFEIKAQYDDNENQLINRKRFRNSISSDKVTENSFEGESDIKETSDNTDYKIRLRNRGQSRFTLQTIGTTASPRPRIRITAGESDEDYEDTTEYIRKYRPDISYEIADLSSLTAVDLKDASAGNRNGFGRRRLPSTQNVQTTLSATTITSTTKPDASSKTGARTIPLARKFLENTSFGRGRRLKPTTTVASATTESTVNTESQIAIKRFRLKRPLNRSEVQNNVTTNISNNTANGTSPVRYSPKIPIHRKLIISPERNTNITNKIEVGAIQNIAPGRKSIVTRRRKILKRPRTSTQRSVTESTTPATTEKPTTSALVIITENTTSQTYNATDTSPLDEYLNINIITKTDLLNWNESQSTSEVFGITTPFISTSNFADEINTTDRNEDDQNSIGVSDKSNIINETLKDDIDSKSTEDDDEEEGENIKLSESIVRENSQIGDFQNGNVIRGFGKSGSIHSYKSNLNNEKVDIIRFPKRPVTEPNIIIRTRKIIRKLNSTEAPTTSDDGNKKRRKIIRRLRPTTSPLNQIDNNQDKVERNENLSSEYASKRRFGFNRQFPSTTTTLNNENSNQDLNGEVNSSTSKAFFAKRRYGSFNRKSSSEQIAKSKTAVLNPDKTAINKSIYNRARSTTVNTRLTPTTISTTTDSPTESSITEESTDTFSFSVNETTEPSLSSGTFITDALTTDNVLNADVSEKTYYSSTTDVEYLEVTENTTEFLSTYTSETLFGTDDSQTSENYNQDSNLSNSVKEENLTSDLIKSTAEFLDTTTNEGSNTIVPILNDSSFSTTEVNEMTMLTELTEDDNIDLLSAIDSTVLTPSTTSTTKLITSSTESALSKLLKRRRFGLSTTAKSQENSQDQNVEFDEKDRISSLNTKFKLRTNAKSTTEKSTTNENSNNFSYDPEYNEANTKINDSILITENPVSTTTLINTEHTDAPVINVDTEKISFPTVTLIDNESDITSDIGTQTDIPESTFLPEEFVSTSFIENYTTHDISHQQSTETLNSQIVDSTESTIEYVSKDPDSSTETLIVNSTEETTTNDLKEILTSEFDELTKTFSTDTTQEPTQNDNDSTTDITNLSTLTISTTSRKPNRLFRPINSRPKYTVRYRPSESTSTAPATSDSGTKSYSRYKFRSRSKNKFTFSSTTEKYDENEELGYGPVKEFKSVLRVNSNIQEKNEYYESKNIDAEEDEEEYEDQDSNDEQDNKDELSNAYVRPSVYDRPYPYKPVNPILQRPSTFAKPEDENVYDVLLPDDEENVDDIQDTPYEDSNKDRRLNEPTGNLYGAIAPVTRVSNAPIDLLTRKSTTKSYKGFKSSTPSPVAQNLSDINIAAINERNRNLFNKTRKVNSPLAAIESPNKSKKNNTIHNVPHVQTNLYESDRSSTYNIPYNPPNLYSSTENSSTVSVLLTQDTLPPVDDTLLLTDSASPKSSDTSDTPSTVTIGTEAYVSPLTATDSQTNEETTEPKSTPITEKSSTLLHIFAETEASITETAIKDNYTDIPVTSNEKKVEKLIEINRVIEVYSKEEFKNGTGVVGSKTFKLKTEPIIDKIGSVSRVTEIKVVEDKNATANTTNTNGTTPNLDSLAANHREDKKYETQNRNDYNFNIPIVTSSDITQINQIHIDSGSVVNKITPKPFDKIETSTIPLEGLFQTESSIKYHHNIKSDSPNEILQGEHSRFVNVRILEQDIADPSAKWNPEAKYIPIKILRNEEEITMKADVVEVAPENKHQTIKIAPIKVSLETNIEHH